jgi:NDP-sugar pyrophosphorylase family protein
LYYYPRATLQLIRQYLADGNNPDQPGRLIQWMYTRTPFYVWRIPGIWFDVGSKETLEEANRIFSRPDIREMRREGFAKESRNREAVELNSRGQRPR